MRRSRRTRWITRVLAVLTVVGLGVPWTASLAQAAYNPVPRPAWNPTSGRVYAMARVGNAIVLGGSFTALWSPVNGVAVARNYLAAVDATTGELLPWNPNSNGEVRALEASADGTTVYVGGAFTSIGGVAKARLAAVSVPDGTVVAGFTANAAATVTALELSGPTLYVGGYFTTLGGKPRQRLAAVDAGNGAVSATFTGSADAAVRSILASPDGTTLAVGGEFATLSGAPRAFLGSIDRNGVATSWTPPAACNDLVLPCFVWDLTQDDTTIYAGVAGPGGRVVAYTRATGVIRWLQSGDGDVQGITLSRGVVYGGGHFDLSFAGQPRAGVVALRASDGAVMPFAPQLLNGLGVFDLLPSDDYLRVGGGFELLDATNEQRYAEFPVLPDTVPPTVPTGLKTTLVGDTHVDLAWNAATDDEALAGYRVLRDGVVVATTATTSWSEVGLTPATTYHYSVVAVDAANNVSAPGTALAVTTKPLTQVLLPLGSTWRYLSNGSNQGTAWRASGFNDAAWPVGPAQLGFGDGDEATVIGSTGTTRYFRAGFTITSPGQFSSLTASLVRDDGAVVYLNGTEVWRSNMPAGTISATTLPSSAVSGTAESQVFTQTLPLSALVPGANVIAVEVHNASASSDVSFDLGLEGTVAPAPDLAAPSTPAAVHTTAVTATSVALAWDAATDDRGVTGYRVLRDGVVATTVTATSWTDSGRTPGATHVYTVQALDAAGNASAPSDPVSVTLPMPVGTLVPRGATWKYRAGTTGVSGTAWAAAGFDDTSWASGAAELGFGDGGEHTVLASGSMTYYFRSTFTVADPQAIAAATLSLVRDDGAAVYVNGVEVVRSNLPAGALTSTTKASANVSGAAESQVFSYSVPPSVLVAGVNVIAVEVHQDVATSSDISFDLGLSAS